MAENGLLAEAQALRALIMEYHRTDRWIAVAAEPADGPALRKFRAYWSRVFDDNQRQERLSAMGILVGRPLETSKALTIGEVFAFLTWFEDGPSFRVRPGAERLLVALRDRRDFRVRLRAQLGKVQLGRFYAETEQEDDAAWVPTSAHKDEAVPF